MTDMMMMMMMMMMMENKTGRDVLRPYTSQATLRFWK
jgi:hypothetical protein